MGGSGVLMVFAGLLLVVNDGKSSSTELTVRDVYLELKEVSAEWERLGFLLGLPQDRLDAIEKDCRNVDTCYQRMLHAWYDESLNPSWDIVTWALDQMGKKRLAKLIKDRYIYNCDSCDCDKSSCTHEHTHDPDTEVNVLGNHAERMREIESGYIELAYEVMTSMKKKNVNLEEVKFWLTQIPVNLIYTHKHFLEGKHIQLISRAQSLLEVFGYLRPYWNFLDYGLLEYVAITFGNDEVKQSMRRYIHELTSFRKTIPLSEFMKLWPNRIDPPPEFSKLVTKLNITQSHWTLQDAEEFRLTFAKNYSLVTFALMYGAFENGSVVLTWFIPSSIAPQLVQDVKNGGSGFLKEHNITEMSIDGHTVAIVDSNAKIWNLSTHTVHFWRTRYVYFLQPEKDIVLSCSKTCANASPPIWYHTLSKDPWLPMSLVATGSELGLSLHQPPVTTDVGYFCCACVGDHPKVDAICFGVAYMPFVAHFAITRKGKAISGVHIGDHIVLECEVFGFPSHVDIAGHSEVAKSLQYTRVSLTWYSKMHYINISHATINHSGVYTCAALLHASPDLYVMTEHVKRSVVVYSPPTITGLRRLTENGRKMFNYPADSDVVLCNVTSSVIFSITWLFNGELLEYATSECDFNIHTSDVDDFTCVLEVPQAVHDKGKYECIVNTAYENKEVSQTVIQHEIPVSIVLSLMVAFIATSVALILIIETFMVKARRKRYTISSMPELYKARYSIPMTEEALQTTEFPTTKEPLQTTELPTSEEPLQTTELPTSEEPLQTTELPTSEEPLQTTELPTSEEPLQTTELPTSEEPLQTTELPTSEEPLQTTELPTSEEPLQTTELPTSEEPLQTTELPTSEEPLQTTELPTSEEPLQTTELPCGEALQTTKLPMSEEAVLLHQVSCSSLKPMPAITISGVSYPIGIAVNNRGEIAVTEGKCISIFTHNGEKKLTFSSVLHHSRGVAFDSAGNILVTDGWSHCITKFTPEGKFLTAVGRKGSKNLEFDCPTGIGVSHKYKKVYVCDQWNKRVQVLKEDLTFSSSFGSKGSGDGKFDYPCSVAFDSNGDTYVADSWKCCIQVFTPEGRFLRKFGKKGSGEGELNYPSSVNTDSNDLVYVTERDNHRVSIFTCQGKFVQSFGTEGTGIGEFNEPRGIAVDKCELVYVSDTFNHRVQGFMKDSSLPTTAIPPTMHFSMSEEAVDIEHQSFHTGVGMSKSCHQPSSVSSLAVHSKHLSHMEHTYLGNVSKSNTFEQLHEDILKSPKPVLTIGGVSNPSGIAVNSRGTFAVAEHNCISIFTSSGEKFRTFRISSEPCQVWHPCGVVFDSAGNILVTDVLSHCIKKFTPEGKFLTAIGRKGSKELEFSYPAGIGINHDNNKVYICDRWNSRIQILNKDLTFSSSFGCRGSGYGQFKLPHDVAFDSNGSAYVADSANCRIQVFTQEGKFLREFGKRGSARGELYFPSSVSIDSDDIVYVTERDNHRVSIFTRQGKLMRSFGTEGERPGEFNEPCGIAVNGLVCVSDTFNHRVQGFKKDPSLPTTAIPPAMHFLMSEEAVDVKHQPFYVGIGVSQPCSVSSLAVQTEHRSYMKRTGTCMEHPYMEHPYINMGYVPKPFEQLRQDIPMMHKPFMPGGVITTKEAIQATDHSHPWMHYMRYPQSRRVLSYSGLREHYIPPTTKEALQTTGLSRTKEVSKYLSSVSLSCHSPTYTCENPKPKVKQVQEDFPKSLQPEVTFGGVSYPSGIAVNNRGEIAVTECNCISIFTSSGEKMNTFGITSELGQFSCRHPCGVVFDSAGNILVTDIPSHCIKKFTPEGEFLTAVGRKGNEEFEFSYPAGIGIHHTSTKLYICDRYNHRVQILNNDLTFSSSFGSLGSDEGLFKFPWDVAFDSIGSVYIADSCNHRIQVFTPEGGFLREFGRKGSGEGELSLPSGVCIDSDDRVYVTERNNHRVSIFTCQGKFMQSFGIEGERPGEFNEPWAVTVDASGLVYVCDTLNNRVQGFTNLITS